VPAVSRLPGMIEITLPANAGEGELVVE
jgi:hypothetical protein